MKKTWPILCLTGLLVLGLAGCNGGKTGSHMAGPSPSPSQSVGSVARGMDRDHNGNPGDDDLAGADGVVGGGKSAAGNARSADRATRGDDSALHQAGDAIRDTLDDIGSAARTLGRDAQKAIEG